MDRVFPITIFGREILLLRDIPTVEYSELEKVVNALFFIGIFSMGIFSSGQNTLASSLLSLLLISLEGK